MDAVDLDGSRGEGGGQILRTALSLSAITGRPLALRNIRAGRAKPGLRRQHLTCVEAAAALCDAEVHGATVGSRYLEMIPKAPIRELAASWPPEGISLAFDIGTAGSTTLVIQTVLMPAIAAGRAVRVTVDGGTHNPMAPPFEFLDRVFAPHLRAMGARFSLALERYGFVSGPPAEIRERDGRGRRVGRGRQHGERAERDNRAFYDAPIAEHHRGRIVLAVEPGALARHECVDAPPVTARHAVAITAGLPTHVATRELGVIRERLGFAPAECEVRELPNGPANVVMLEVERTPSPGFELRELVTVHGAKGLRAETVATRACDELASYLSAGVPIGTHLADQLLLPLAVAGGGRFRCAPLSRHATTNIDTVQAFLALPIRVVPDGDAVIVELG